MSLALVHGSKFCVYLKQTLRGTFCSLEEKRGHKVASCKMWCGSFFFVQRALSRTIYGNVG